ncbi:MAG TPA: hypothetical protein VFB31_10625, partial [Pseudolabrys sp.]|nr:hypothetical protein [Pseudolabrys sp.]
QGDPKVYLFNIETGQREIVGNFPGMTFAPRFSPDGQRVIMSLQQGGNSNLFVMDLRSRSTTRLTDTPAIDTSPSYSPDGTRICFESDRGGHPQIYIMAATGGTAKRISFGGDGIYSTPVWSPRGDYIAFTGQAGGQFSIGILKPDGSGERILTAGFHNEGPTFAPNGRVIMSLQQGGNANLFVMDLRSKQTTRLTDTPAIDTAPCYSPDGRYICFESDRGGTQQIYVMPANGGAAQRISFGEGQHSTPVWSPRGDYIAFTGQARGQFSIGILKPDGSGERILTQGFHNEGPTFAPNGRVLMFFRDPGVGPNLYTIDITGRNELKEPTPSYASDPAWSPLLS